MREKPLILLVDDEENFLEIMSAKLDASGFDTACAHNEAEAMKQAETLFPDMILMDIHMPGATGTDAALSIKQNPKLQGIRIAFLTSLKDPWPAIKGDRDKVSQELGMEDYFEKTEDLDTLVEKIRGVLMRGAETAQSVA